MNLRTKFAIDEACFHTDALKVFYTYSRLRGRAAQRILPWLSAQDANGVKFNDLIAVMDKAFGDPDKQRKALVRVNTMKQGRKELDEFLNDFDEALLEAGGMNWSHDQKKAVLDTAVSWRLIQGMVGIPQEASYEGYCDQLRRVNHDLQRIARLSKGSAYVTSHRPMRRSSPDKMDWESTSTQIAALKKEVNALRTKYSDGQREARWASDAEMEKRRKNGSCLRCGGSGHFIRDCTKKAPRRPEQVAPARVDDNHHDNEPNSESDEDLQGKDQA
jgi:hypothetical protein